MTKYRLWAAQASLIVVWILANGAHGWYYGLFRDDWEFLGRAATWPYGTRTEYFFAHQLTAYRPLSFLLDVEVWSRLWPHETLVWALLLITMVITVFWARSMASQETGQPLWLASAVWLFWPGVVEGQSWIVGATGIVPSLFFLVAGFWFLLGVIHNKTPMWVWTIGAGISFLVSDLCYEQSWFAAFVIVAVIVYRYRQKFWLLATPPLVALGITGWWYAIHQTGLRYNGKKPILSLQELNHTLHILVPQFGVIWGSQLVAAWREAFTMTMEPWYWWTEITLAVGLMILATWTRHKDSWSVKSGGILIGVGMAWWIAAYLPWFLTRYGWIADRSITVSAVGLGLILEGFWILLRHVFGVFGRIGGVLALALILLGGANLRALDINAYARSDQLDLQLATTAHRVLTAHHITHGILTSFTPVNSWVAWDYYGQDHISSTWSAPWGVQLMLEDLSGGRDLFKVLAPTSPASDLTRHMVGLVVTRHRPRAIDLAQADAVRGLVFQVSLSHHNPHLIRWAWFNHR